MDYRHNKSKRVGQFLADIDRQLLAVDVQSQLKVFTYPLDDVVADYQWRAFLNERATYPEDFAAFKLVSKLFSDFLGTDYPDQADYFFVPFYWPAMEFGRIELRKTMEELQFLGTGKPHLLFSPWDTYARPLTKRSNPYCSVDYGREAGKVEDEYYTESLAWMDERFSLICYESTLDLLPYDIGTYPTLPRTPEAPSAHPRPFLYSFVGSFFYFNGDHIRGEDHLPDWKRLHEMTVPDVFVGTLDHAKKRFGKYQDYFSFPRQSMFTLCPAGWARWSFRMTESILSGSIPVILSDYYQLPFSDQIPWDQFTIRVPESGLERIDQVLRNIPEHKVRWMQLQLQRHQHLFTSAGVLVPLVRELEIKHEQRPWAYCSRPANSILGSNLRQSM